MGLCVSGAPDRLLANSKFVQRRIAKAWNRDSKLVYPPVPLDEFAPSADIDDHYLWVGQLAPYKRAELAVDAFNELGLPLLMVGDGPLAARIRARKRDNIKLISKLSFADLKHCIQSLQGPDLHCRRRFRDHSR